MLPSIGLLRISLTCVLLAACSDPTVDVSVVVATTPRDYAPSIEALAISVLATEDPVITCDAIAYGEIDDDVLALAEVTGVTLQRDDGLTQVPIAGVPRLGRKLWVAIGRNEDGAEIVGGCTEQGDITADTTLTITTEAIGTLAVPLHPADEPVPGTLHVTLDDGDPDEPRPLAGREVRWEVYGSGIDPLSGEPDTTDDAGALDVALDAPEVFGPASIQLRARWARNQPDVTAAFQMVEPVELSINRACTGSVVDSLTVDTASWGQFRLDDQIAIAGLARDDTRSRLYVAAWDGANAADDCSADLPGVTTFAILRGGASDPLDRLLVVTATEWIEHEVTAGADTITLTPRTPTAWDNPVATPPLAVVTMRACGRDDGDLDYVLAQTADDTVIALDPEGNQISRPFATALNSALPELGLALLVPRIVKSGCISQGPDEPPLQALIVSFVRTGDGSAVVPRVLAIDDPDDHFEGVPVPSVGAVAFTAVSLQEPYLLGGAIDPTGTKVVRWRLTPGADGLELREEARDDSLGPPASIALGYVDGDEHLDTVWGLVDAIAGGVEESRLQMSMGRGAGTVALNSVTPEVESPGAAVFLAPTGAQRSDLAIGGGRFALFLDTDLDVTP